LILQGFFRYRGDFALGGAKKNFRAGDFFRDFEFFSAGCGRREHGDARRELKRCAWELPSGCFKLSWLASPCSRLASLCSRLFAILRGQLETFGELDFAAKERRERKSQRGLPRRFRDHHRFSDLDIPSVVVPESVGTSCFSRVRPVGRCGVPGVNPGFLASGSLRK